MIFRVFKKGELKALYDAVSCCNKVAGPVINSKDISGNPLYSFEVIRDFNDLKLDYPPTRLPAKRFSLPYVETIARFNVNGADWQKRTDYGVEGPMVLFGLHPCDINALNKLDKVLINSPYPMPHYAARRANMFIVGVDCTPCEQCFCRSMGTDTALHGFDIFITDLGDSYFAEIMTDTAFEFVKQIRSSEPKGKDHILYRKAADRKSKMFRTRVDTTDLTKILDMEFQSNVWDYWGRKCLSCGTCANVCPTCYCYGVKEDIGIDLKSASKTKQLYSCNLIDFAKVAGGHNFRESRSARLKYRYYHKHRGFVEAFEESLCVGCGRCGVSCLAGITVPDVISSIRAEKV